MLFGFPGEFLQFLLHLGYFVHGFLVLPAFYRLVLRFSYLFQRLFFVLQVLQLLFEVFKLVFLFDDFVDVVLVIEVSSEAGDFRLVLLYPDLLVFELSFEFVDPFVLLRRAVVVFFLLPLSFLFQYLIHFRRQLLQLRFQLDVLFD